MSDWKPIETAPEETELRGWRADCGEMLIIYTSYDRYATASEADEMGDDALFQKDWFGAGIPYGFIRLDGSEAPTHWKPLDAPPST